MRTSPLVFKWLVPAPPWPDVTSCLFPGLLASKSNSGSSSGTGKEAPPVFLAGVERVSIVERFRSRR